MAATPAKPAPGTPLDFMPESRENVDVVGTAENIGRKRTRPAIMYIANPASLQQESAHAQHILCFFDGCLLRHGC